MYNKLFTKIVDSSIWLAPDATRIVWVTCLAVMDEDGFVQMASVANLANRANVTMKSCQRAVEILEGPDPDSSNPDHEGRRLERVQGGWMVLNAKVHRDLITREVAKIQTKERVRRYRERKRNALVTPSEAVSEAETEREKKPKASLSPEARLPKRPDAFNDEAITERAGRFLELYQELYPKHRHGARYALRDTRDYAAAVTLCATWTDDDRLRKLAIVFLESDHKFAEEGSRTVPQFLALASWCDGKLAEWEQKQARA